jgi:hypothetical protein
MPNGGSDCCGTCWFNEANEGEAGYRENNPERPQVCLIRQFEIENAFWTYCANHPHHNPDRIETPIGPVYVAGSYPYSRTVLSESVDTEEIRLSLLGLLEKVVETPSAEYPTPTKFDEEIIKQLMSFREERATDQLRRIAAFDPHSGPSGDNPFKRNRVLTVALAIEALAAIENDGAMDQLERAIESGLPPSHPDDYSESDDKLAPIRYHAVLGLKHCSTADAKVLLKRAASDPHSEIRAFAGEILGAASDA